MKNEFTKRIVSSLMIGAFMVSSTMNATFALNDFYDYDNLAKPMIRANEMTSVDIDNGIRIPNANSIVNLSLRDADVKQVLRMFADQAGMNIIMSPAVDGSVTLDLINIPLEEALNLVVKTNDLYVDIQANTMVVSRKSEAISVAAKGMTLIPVKYVNAGVLADFLNKNIFNADNHQPGLSSNPVVTINPATNELIVMGTASDVAAARKIVAQFDVKPAITTFKVNHTTPAEMASLVCDAFLPSTINNGAGGSTGGAAPLSKNNKKVNNKKTEGTPTGFAAAESAISVGGGQMLCSAESSASAGSLESLPFKTLSVSYFPALGTIQVIGGSETQIQMIRDYIAANDKKTPQAYLEVQIISLSESGSKTFDNNWQFYSHNFSFNAGGGRLATDPIHPIFFAGRGYEVYDGSKYPYTQVGDINKWSTSPQLVYTVNYLVSNSKGRVLANPRILMTSGQSSTIDLTSDYVSKVTSQYLDNGSSTGSAQVQKDYEISDDNGIKVEITPFISPDGYVTLDIKPEYATIKEQMTAKGNAGTDDVVATLLQRRNLDLKGVRIKDGETLVIGGMIQEQETKTVSKIPFLGDIPVLGMFFRSTTTSKGKEEMVIMLTPQIIVDTEDVAETKEENYNPMGRETTEDL